MTENNDKRPAFSSRSKQKRTVEVEDDLGPGCKRLSRNIPAPVKRQIVDFVSKYGQQTGVEIPEIELDELDDEWEEEEEG
jgi:hypothetical protein